MPGGGGGPIVMLRTHERTDVTRVPDMRSNQRKKGDRERAMNH